MNIVSTTAGAMVAEESPITMATIAITSYATESTAAASMLPTVSLAEFPTCKTSPLWNWYTIDACFISDSWHITSTAMFAGSCIGVVLLVITLAFIRRLSREYDTYNCRQHVQSLSQSRTAANAPYLHPNMQYHNTNEHGPRTSNLSNKSEHQAENITKTALPNHRVASFRPSLLQQLFRAVLFTIQAIAAYFIVLVAMHYNGYLFICIVAGVLLGEFLFSWENVSVVGNED